MTYRPLFVPAKHPSLVDAYEQFVTEVGEGQRYFGRRRSDGRQRHVAVFKAMRRHDVMALAAVAADRIVAVACVCDDGGIAVITVPEWRGSGLSSALVQALADRYGAAVSERFGPRSA